MEWTWLQWAGLGGLIVFGIITVGGTWYCALMPWADDDE